MIVTVIGARPQFVKAAVVSKALKDLGIEEKIIHTGQHYDTRMSQVFWDELGIPPYALNLEVGSGTHGQQTARMLEKIETYLLEHEEKVKAVMVYGDTNSTIAAALAASKLHIKVIHVEAGLRSFNRLMPEEINRILTDHISDLLFCSSVEGVQQLTKEGIKNNVYDVGDVMYDALLSFLEIAERKIELKNILPFENQDFALATIHRPSNTDDFDSLNQIIEALGQLNMNCLWPVHPRNKKRLSELRIPANLFLIEPVSYLEMLVLLKNCYKVLTDSGGVQKEAYWMRKPCVTLRKETEWVETLEQNWNILAHNDTKNILSAFKKDIDRSTWKNIYGDGKAAKKIAATIHDTFYKN